MKKIYIVPLLLFHIFLLFPQDGNDKKDSYYYYLNKDYTTALRLLEEEKKTFPNRADIYVIMAWCYRDLRNYPMMEKVSKEGLTVRRYDIRIIRNLAESQYFQKKYSDAVNSLESYIGLRYKFRDNYLFQAYIYLGESYLFLEAYNKADIALSMAKTYRPSHVRTLILLAQTNEKLENNKKANTFYQQVLKINPSHQEAIEGVNRTKDTQ